MTKELQLASQIYRVCVRNILDEGWVRALEVDPISTHRHYSGPPRTVFTLRLADQAEMLALLNRLHDMSLSLLSVELSLGSEADGQAASEREEIYSGRLGF